ncbi:hypothetical protein BABINDRAFT_168646 [Babjeviella inositovora NRRL Y-12698]|uniref:Biogenesis of lysosome-related organelles complex 1 subunit KXD1 n=1 Tax=Babjeviella inositovora NRRL Y-12698 TaxID=984486 RepID=A0A1E3QK99_9ASCO|nr:uncharacterized protein BABINDRAFT_168646 [Babjeviella inositovora NRRL Y-12698]ODQ78070.1 hypothetical protein BABINDRAFT_168646 [Babjeviella inositovora NRRL Y-12698]
MPETRSVRSHSRSPSIDALSFVVVPVEDDTEEYVSDASSSLSYAGSVNEGSRPFSSIDYLTNSLHNTLQSIELDRAMVLQAQFSGRLRAKSMELHELMTEVEEKLREVIQLCTETKPIVRQTKQDLQWADKHVTKLMKVASKEWPIEYNKGKDKVINRVIDEDGP